VTAELLVAGSIALDTLEVGGHVVENELGGSALYFALAASLIVPVRMVAPVGRDAERDVMAVLGSRPIDTSLVEVVEAPTYRWHSQVREGRNIDLGSRDTVYDVWEPRPPSHFDGWAFAGSMRPDRQAQAVQRLAGAELVAADAMLSYIHARPPEAREVLRGSRWYFCNRDEFAALGGSGAQDFRRDWDLEGLVVKAGREGVTAYVDDAEFHVPALAHQRVVDTTGAGDAMAAGMLAHWLLAGGNRDALRESLLWGVACASLTIEEIGVRGIAAATREQLSQRVEEVRRNAVGDAQPN
jgi:sugar/nucleoside kinase (ribokinase family)